jgi:hypothetical protein
MDWKSIVSNVAPVLGTAIGGPFGGIAAKFITGAILGEDHATDDIEAAQKAIAGASPDQLLALKQADHAFKLEMKKLDIDVERLANDDRRSARDREIQTKDKMPAFIALAGLTGFFGILAAMAFVVLPEGSQQPLAVMLGALGALVGQIGNYYFGSSAGSARKNEMIAAFKK